MNIHDWIKLSLKLIPGPADVSGGRGACFQACFQDWQPEFNFWDPFGRRELIPTAVLWAPCVHSNKPNLIFKVISNKKKCRDWAETGQRTLTWSFPLSRQKCDRRFYDRQFYWKTWLFYLPTRVNMRNKIRFSLLWTIRIAL